MFGLTFDPTVKLSDLFTPIAIAVASASLISNVLKDKYLRQKEYADKIRNAASRTSVALDRWRALALSFYNEIQPAITRADMRLVESQNVVKSRDEFWLEIVQQIAQTSARIRDENVESSYAELYGYHPEVQSVFGGAIDEMRRIFKRTSDAFLQDTQSITLAFKTAPRPIESAQLGDALRRCASHAAQRYETALSAVIEPLRNQLLLVISLPDTEVIKKYKIKFAPIVKSPDWELSPYSKPCRTRTELANPIRTAEPRRGGS